MNQTSIINPWSLYWSEDKLHSCVAQSSSEDQAVLNKYWQNFAHTLQTKSRLLDLATGNGAVVNALLSAHKEIQIDAIDKARINPQRILKSHSEIENINFHSEMDIFASLFEEATFDAITSQFGIEYAGLLDASIHVVNYLKVGGHFQFVVHHCESGVIESSKTKILELKKLTEKEGILETLIGVLGDKTKFTDLEDIGQAYLEQDLIKTEQISGQVFAGIERIINGWNVNRKESIELGVAMDLRVRAELARLLQLTEAGQSEKQMTSWINAMSNRGCEATVNPLYLDPDSEDYLLGWSANGIRHK